MSSASFARMATVTASTKRNPGVIGKQQGEPVTYIASLACTPLDPVDPEVRQTLGLGTPHLVLETFCDGSLDIREGDTLVVDGVDYPVRAAEVWAWGDSQYLHLIIEKLKR